MQWLLWVFGSGTSFWCTFLHDFSTQNVRYLIFYLWPKFQCHNFFPSQSIKQGVIQKVRSLRRGVGVIEKRTKLNSGRRGSSMSVRSLF